MKNQKIDRNQSMIISLDEMISEDSNVRVIDAYVRSLDVEKLGYHIYTNKVGRPAYNPQELIGLYLYGYMSRVMSSRMLEQQTYINIEIMWLLNNTHPDHSTIAAFRAKNSLALTNTFYDFVNICNNFNLIGGKTVAIDGTKIRANNSKKNNYSEKSLSRKIEHINEQITEYFAALDKNDKSDVDITALSERKEEYETLLEKLSYSEETQISTIDPDARLMDNKNGGLDVAYNIQATVDSRNALVIDQYVTNAPTDQGELSKASARAQEILSKKELTILADKGYYNGKDLEDCFSLGVTPVVAKQKSPKRQGMYSLDDFTYDKETDTFTCPQNKILSKISNDTSKTTVYANKPVCASCPHKAKCFKQGKRYKYRKICKDKYFQSIVRANVLFEENKRLYRRRQELNEHVFGSIKRQLGFPQLNVRTKQKVSGEVSLLFLGYNLKRVINIVGKTDLIMYFREKLCRAIRIIIKRNLIFIISN